MKNKFFLKVTISLTVIFVVLIALILSWARFFDIYELPLLDLRYQFRPSQNINNKIVFIEIADDSINKIGSWPFPREYHAVMIQALRHSNVKSIFVDIFFSTKSEKEEVDQKLAQQIKLAGNVYIPSVFSLDISKENDLPMSDEYEAELLDIFTDVVKATGHINIIPDKDGKYRRIPPFIRYKRSYVPQLGFLMALDLMGKRIEDIVIKENQYIQVSDEVKIPLDERSNILINFPGKWVDTFRHYSYIDILSSYQSELKGQRGVIDLSELEGSVCYIGMSSSAASDAHPSPYEALYPGVGLHASLYNSMLNKEFIFRVSKWINVFILLGLLLGTYFCVQVKRKRESIFVFTVLLLGFSSLGFLVFMFFGAWIDLFCPLFEAVVFYMILIFTKYLIEIKQRELLERELSIAKEIQQSFLPVKVPNKKDMEIAVNMITAKQVGGDLYDFVQFTDEKTGVMIGDVSGKGVPAALYMAKAVSLFKQLVKDNAPDQTLLKLNDILAEESSSSLFVTMCYAIFDMNSLSVSFASGGHSPIMLYRSKEDAIVELENEEGLPLGMLSCDFDLRSSDIKKGDIYVFYTDGVTEAMDKKGEMFEKERLADVIKAHKNKTAQEIAQAIQKSVVLYEQGSQHDDITVLVVKIAGNG